jgi:hypothetical protein
MTELKACPICKGTRICIDGGDNTYYPRCLDCGCTAPHDAWQTTRTSSPAEVERLVDRINDELFCGALNGETKSRLLAALINTTPYLSQDVKGVYKYEIDSPDELDAGLHGFGDEVTVIVDSGEPGGDPTGEDSFEEYMRQALIEWFDGAKVVFKKAGE